MIETIIRAFYLERTGSSFNDVVVNKQVYHWRDRRDGSVWMKHTRWDLFEVSVEERGKP